MVLTASKLSQFNKCPASVAKSAQFFVSPQSTEIRRAKAERGSPAYLGNKCHEVLQMCLKDHQTIINRQALKRGIDVYGVMSKADRKVISRVQQISKGYTKTYTEIPFGYNFVHRKSEILGSYGEASYGTVIAGTADFVFASEDKLFIGDWKTGFDEIDPPGQNLQLAVLAEMAAAWFAVDRSNVLVCIANPILGQIEIDKPLRFDLSQLSYDMINSLSEKALPSAGSCRYCAFKTECEAFYRYSSETMNELSKNDPVES